MWVRIDEPPPAAAKIPSPETPGFGGPTDVSWFNLDALTEAHPGILSFDSRLKNNTLEAVELAGKRAQAAVAKARESGKVNLVFTVEDTGMGEGMGLLVGFALLLFCKSYAVTCFLVRLFS